MTERSCGKIRHSFLKNFHVAGRELKITASIGISIYPDDSEEIEAVFRNADQANANRRGNA